MPRKLHTSLLPTILSPRINVANLNYIPHSEHMNKLQTTINDVMK